MSSIFGTPLYQELTEAFRAGDSVRVAAIIERGIAETTGPQQANWKRLQWGRRWAYFATPDRWKEAWAELHEMLQMAPDDLDTQRDALAMSLSLVPYYERLRGLSLIIPLMRANLPELMKGWGPRYFLGRTLLIRREWRRAYTILTRSAESLENAAPERREAQKGNLNFIYADAACAALRAGHPDSACMHIEQAEAIERLFRPNYLHPAHLAFAKAELALWERRHTDALSIIQDGISRIEQNKHKLSPAFRACFDLLAARVARAEGNTVGFRHFAERALAISLENQLTWSERTVRAVLDGSPY